MGEKLISGLHFASGLHRFLGSEWDLRIQIKGLAGREIFGHDYL